MNPDLLKIDEYNQEEKQIEFSRLETGKCFGDIDILKEINI
jgi:hypothetical protein